MRLHEGGRGLERPHRSIGHLWLSKRLCLIYTCGPGSWLVFTVQLVGGGCRLTSPRSLQHDIFEVFLQDGVLDGMKDKADIFRVYGSGEVVEERLAPVSPLTAERLHEECLGETGREEIEGLEYLIGI